jgi:hypothetical protein
MKKITFIVLFFSAILLTHNSNAQQEFQVTSLSHTESHSVDINYSLNGGLVSVSGSDQNGLSYIELQKLLINFGVEWSTSFFGADSMIDATAFTETPGRGLIIVAQVTESGVSTDPASDILILKTDEDGILQWSQLIDHYHSDKPRSVVSHPDSTIFIVSQSTTTLSPPFYNISLIRCDQLGNVIWSKSISNGDNEIPSKLILTSDDQLVLAGTQSSFAGGTSFFLSKIDTSGNYLWFNIYFTGVADTCYGLIQTNDGGYMLVGSGGLDGNDVVIIKTDQNGVLQLCHSYNLGFGSNRNIDKGIRIVNTSDGGYAISGETQIAGSALPFFFCIKTFQNLSVDWYNTYGFQKKNEFAALLQTPDNGFLMAGSRINPFTPKFRNLLVKTDSIGNTACLQTIVDLNDQVENPFPSTANPSTLNTVTSQIAYPLTVLVPVHSNDTACYLITAIESVTENTSFDIYPNPFSDMLTIELKDLNTSQSIEVRIADQLGRNQYSAVFTDVIKKSSVDLNLSSLSAGIYILNIYSADTPVQYKKIICYR